MPLTVSAQGIAANGVRIAAVEGWPGRNWRRGGLRPARCVLGDGHHGKARRDMIPRYTRPEMARIWAPETRFRIWFEIEAHAATAMAGLGLIPRSAAEAIWARGSATTFDPDRIAE